MCDVAINTAVNRYLPSDIRSEMVAEHFQYMPNSLSGKPPIHLGQQFVAAALDGPQRMVRGHPLLQREDHKQRFLPINLSTHATPSLFVTQYNRPVNPTFLATC